MDELLTAADTLCTLVRGSYGPSGDEVLIFSPPDAPLVTADGHTVLRARKQQNANANAPSPFERVILDAAESVYREAGDGGTQFVLLLHSMLHQVARGSQRLDAAERVRMARALGTLRQEWDTQTIFLDEIQNHFIIEEGVELQHDQSGVWMLTPTIDTRIRHVLFTALAGVIGHRVVYALVELVMQWVFSSVHQPQGSSPNDPVTLINRRLQQYVQHAPRTILHAHGALFTASYVVSADEFVLQKSLVPSQLPSLLHGVSPLHFVCFTASIDLTVGANHIIFEAADQEQAFHAIDGVRLKVVQFLTELRTQHDVRLLVSTEKIDDYVAAACTHLQIACVQYAEHEDVVDLCSVAGIYALTSVADVIDEDSHIGVCLNGASVVRHGSSPRLSLRGLRGDCHTTTPQVVVYASSTGVFKQYYNAMLKSLRVLRSLFTMDSSRRCLRLCRGAGATELTIAKALQQRPSPNDPAVDRASLGLSNALIECVVQLRANLTHGCGASDRARATRQSSRVLLDEMTRFERTKPRGYVLDRGHAIVTTLGSITIPTLVEGDPLALHVVHPWHRVDTIVHVVLQTAQRLLRIDGVVRIKRNPTLQQAGLHEASDDTDD